MAQEFNQGTEYEEDEFEEDVIEEEGAEDTEARITSFYGMPIRNVVIIGAIVLLVIIAVVVFATRKKGGADDAAQPADTDAWLAEQGITPDNTTATTPVGDTTATTPSTGGTVMDGMVYNEATGLWEKADASATDDTVTAEPETATDEERLKLRAMGYSGDEIDIALSEGFSVDSLIESAQELYDEEAEEALVRMSDAASPEFKYIIKNSYFGQTGYEFVDISQADFGTYDYYKGSYVVNADYVKCPTYGAQLQLRCKVAQDLELFYVVSPERFAKLPQEGNIVLRVEYTVYGANTYVTDIHETDPTLDTIDSSASTMDEITADGASTEASVPEDVDTGDADNGTDELPDADSTAE